MQSCSVDTPATAPLQDPQPPQATGSPAEGLHPTRESLLSECSLSGPRAFSIASCARSRRGDGQCQGPSPGPLLSPSTRSAPRAASAGPGPRPNLPRRLRVPALQAATPGLGPRGRTRTNNLTLCSEQWPALPARPPLTHPTHGPQVPLCTGTHKAARQIWEGLPSDHA